MKRKLWKVVKSIWKTEWRNRIIETVKYFWCEAKVKVFLGGHRTDASNTAPGTQWLMANVPVKTVYCYQYLCGLNIFVDYAGIVLLEAQHEGDIKSCVCRENVLFCQCCTQCSRLCTLSQTFTTDHRLPPDFVNMSWSAVGHIHRQLTW